MRGDEERIVQAFCLYLQAEGWTVRREVDHVDVVAERAGNKVYAEAKGRTAAPGLDVDTMFGQILRRMPADLDHEGVRFAVVAPRDVIDKVRRVPRRVRDLLKIDVYAVADDGTVTRED